MPIEPSKYASFIVGKLPPPPPPSKPPFVPKPSRPPRGFKITGAFVYVFRERNQGTGEYTEFAKIGLSKNPTARAAEMSGATPREVVCVAAFHTERALSLERELHDLFRDFWVVREWFYWSRALSAACVKLPDQAQRYVVSSLAAHESAFYADINEPARSLGPFYEDRILAE